MNGARIGQLIILLSRDFIRWVIFSFIIASPVAWYFLNRWLENFAYRTPVSLWIFAIAGGVAFFIVLATVSYHSITAALANPVNSLKYE